VGQQEMAEVWPKVPEERNEVYFRATQQKALEEPEVGVAEQ
jgi:hypothetical protein